MCNVTGVLVTKVPLSEIHIKQGSGVQQTYKKCAFVIQQPPLTVSSGYLISYSHLLLYIEFQSNVL